MNIGRRFKMYREKCGLSQKEAAKQLGVKGYQLANYECNRSEPNLTTLRLMSKVYHVTLDNLLATSGLYDENYFEEEEVREREIQDLKKQINALLDRLVGHQEEDK